MARRLKTVATATASPAPAPTLDAATMQALIAGVVSAMSKQQSAPVNGVVNPVDVHNGHAIPVDDRHPVDVAADRQRQLSHNPVGAIRADQFKEKVIAYKLDENNQEVQDTGKTLHLRNDNRIAVRRELAAHHRQLTLTVTDEDGSKIGTIPLEFRTSKWYAKDGKGGQHHELQYGVASPSVHIPLGNGQYAKIVSSGLYFMVESIVGG